MEGWEQRSQESSSDDQAKSNADTQGTQDAAHQGPDGPGRSIPPVKHPINPWDVAVRWLRSDWPVGADKERWRDLMQVGGRGRESQRERHNIIPQSDAGARYLGTWEPGNLGPLGQVPGGRPTCPPAPSLLGLGGYSGYSGTGRTGKPHPCQSRSLALCLEGKLHVQVPR